MNIEFKWFKVRQMDRTICGQTGLWTDICFS